MVMWAKTTWGPPRYGYENMPPGLIAHRGGLQLKIECHRQWHLLTEPAQHLLQYKGNSKLPMLCSRAWNAYKHIPVRASPIHMSRVRSVYVRVESWMTCAFSMHRNKMMATLSEIFSREAICIGFQKKNICTGSIIGPIGDGALFQNAFRSSSV